MSPRKLTLRVAGAIVALVVLAATSSGVAAFEQANDPCAGYAYTEEGVSEDGATYGRAWWPPFASECDVRRAGRSFAVGLVDWYDWAAIFAGQGALLLVALRRRHPSAALAGAVAAATPIALAGLAYAQFFDYVPAVGITFIYGLPLLAVAAYLYRRARPDRPSLNPWEFFALGAVGLVVFGVLALLPLTPVSWFIAIAATAALAAAGDRALRRLNLRC
jgi:hypothetical protein